MVSVTAEAPILETRRVEDSTYLDQRSVHDLPNNGRNFLSLVPLTPGVSIVQGPDGDEISINGQKGINNNVSIDGADNNNPFFGEQRGGQRPAFTVSLDAIKEFQVVADSAPAEFGRSSGGFINVVTKSGTNDVHGTLHEYQKWTGLTSRLSDGTRLSAFSQEQFGGTIGGAIKKDKLFYFAAYDQQFFTQTKQNNPNRIDPTLVNFFATKFSDPERERPDHPRRTMPSRRWARSTGMPARRTCSPRATTSRTRGSPTAPSTWSSGAAAPTPSSAISPTPSACS